MAKYGDKIVKRICELIRADSYTIPEICRQVGISEDTYHTWKKEKPEFSEAIKKAEDDFLDTLRTEAKRSLMKKVCGYEAQETRTVYVDSGEEERDPATGKKRQKPKIKEKIVITKHIAPDNAAVIFTLTNRDPKQWKNRQSQEVTGKDGKDLLAGAKLIAGMGKDEIAELLSDE